MNRSTTSRWIGRIVLAIVGPLFWLELLLQLGALFTPEAPSASTSDAATEPCCILCVGDSYTFGLGASNSTGSYPAQLEARLRESPLDGRRRVANGGEPSRTSRDVLLDLPRAFRRAQPRFVAILVGVNDLWSRPDPADIRDAERAAGSAATWRFQWRTRKLLQILLNDRGKAAFFEAESGRKETKSAGVAMWSGRAGVANEPPPATRPQDADVCFSVQIVGCWKAGDDELRFAPGGRGRRGSKEFRWRIVRAGELELDFGDGAPASRMKAERRGARLLLIAPDDAKPVLFKEAPDEELTKSAPWEWCEQYDRLLASGDRAGVFAFTERWIAAQPDDAYSWLKHMTAAKEIGRTDVFAADLAALERMLRVTGACDVVESLEFGYQMSHRIQLASDFAREQVARFPRSTWLHFYIAQDADRAGDFEAAVREMTLAIDVGGETTGPDLAFKLRERARWNKSLRRDVDAAADAILATRACADDALDCELLMRGHFEQSAFAQAFVVAGASDAEKAAVQRHFAEVDKTYSRPPPTLVDQLTQMTRWIRDQGAVPLILTYPMDCGVVDAAQREVAQREAVALVDVRARFETLLATHAQDELFAGDGHCNDAGYRVVAEEVERMLQSLAH